MNRHVSIVALCCLLAACAPAAPARTPVTLWGELISFGTAEQVHAPAVTAGGGRVTAFWIGADETGVHQDARTLAGASLSARVVLPLPPRQPYGQQVVPAGGGAFHLLWLDAGETGETRLYSAFITPQLTIERGPVDVSRGRAGRYALLAGDDGAAWVVWSGGLLSEPSLFAARIDAAGRPLLPERLGPSGDWPVLRRGSDGLTVLYWQDALQGGVFAALFSGGRVDAVRRLTAPPLLERGDRLNGVYAGADSAYGYLFWNITRVDGEAQTWISAGEIAAGGWSAPVRLGVDASADRPFETGFNSGAVQAARAGQDWLGWARPLPEQSAVLPVAALSAGGLGIVYLQGGGVAGFQIIDHTAHLVGAPLLLADRDRHLYLAWAQPGAEYADLRLTMSRRE